jgi:hypothetical protein
MTTIKEKMEFSMTLTLGKIARMTALSMEARGERGDISDFIPLLSVKMLDLAKESGATPGQVILAMVNYLSATVTMAL